MEADDVTGRGAKTSIVSVDEALQWCWELPSVCLRSSYHFMMRLARSWLKTFELQTLCLLILRLLRMDMLLWHFRWPGEYPVVAEARAGNEWDLGILMSVRALNCWYGLCSGPIPDGADAVVQVEDTEQIEESSHESKRVRILVQTRKGTDIRPVGCDIEKDAVVLKHGERLGASEIGLLATVGVMMVKVYRPPTVAGPFYWRRTCRYINKVLKSWPVPSFIRDSNRAMILTAAKEQQCKLLDLNIVKDDEGELERVVDGAVSAGIDILLTSGGVSMGDKDFVKPLLKKRGTVYFSKVNMKPGKPLTFAEIIAKPAADRPEKKILAFGLPGNPVSSLVCFHLFVVPAIRRLSGWANPHLLRVQARLCQHLSTDPVRPEFHRAIVRWEVDDGSGKAGFVAESTGHQTSSGF
ncbi:hypothetical protein F8388_000707 [Cannabis sativa]|uniref:Molybdopterin biosynthesis protein CNX1 n=1 Tax=Cannabis sativa TaxID=3483 RepID=A0A7J6EF05_CANSA|nr:hypothetical protein F8388_000707 [Cannabis sativa]